MNNPHDLHCWSKDHRAWVVDAAQRRALLERARRENRGSRRMGLAWSNALAPLLRRSGPVRS
jgi:hypothetical protein